MIRHNVLKALRDAQEASEAAGRRTLSARDGALLGARVAIDAATASIKKIRFVPTSQHERHITKLIIARVQKHLADMKMDLEVEPS